MNRNKTPLPKITDEHMKFMRECIKLNTCNCNIFKPTGSDSCVCPLSGGNDYGCTSRYDAAHRTNHILPFFRDLIAAS